MALGLLLSIAALAAAPRSFDGIAADVAVPVCLLLPMLPLAIAVARLAAHRFFTPADIDGSGLTAGTAPARLLQALLQNTLEQVALAVPTYAAALYAAPATAGRASVAAACLFLLGRVLFFARYRHGAAARALGFALTFYPTVLLLLWQTFLLARSALR
ncbi:MAG TPA: MAPEG family protein [Dokdonella sp.]